jgi:hypothetical protein
MHNLTTCLVNACIAHGTHTDCTDTGFGTMYVLCKIYLNISVVWTAVA